MLIKDKKDNQIEIRDSVWILAEDLFLKWGSTEEELEEAKTSLLNVKDLDDITPELSAWGIPWKRIGE